MSRRTRITLVVAGALVALAAGTVAGASTTRCLPPVCKRGQKTHCCTEPICDFMVQVRMKRAMQSFFLNAAERGGVGRGPGADANATNRERQAQQAALDRALKDPATKRQIFGDCDADMNDTMPAFETNQSCMVEMNGRPSSREGAQERGSSCKEFVDAAYDHEEVHKASCYKMGGAARGRQSIGDYSLEEVEGYQKEIDSLTSQLSQWARSCSKTPAGKKVEKQLKEIQQSLKNTERRRKSLERQQDHARGGVR
jgi:hypothetical protein